MSTSQAKSQMMSISCGNSWPQSQGFMHAHVLACAHVSHLQCVRSWRCTVVSLESGFDAAHVWGVEPYSDADCQ